MKNLNKMTKRLKKHAPMLQHLCKAKPANVKSIIKTSDNVLVNVLCECALNVLQGNVTLSKPQRKRLARHKKGLRDLTNKRISLQKKKNTLQRGGFLGALLSPIIGILGSLLGGR